MEVLDWQGLKARYPSHAVEMVKSSIDKRVTPQKSSAISMGARSFMTWLSTHGASFKDVRNLFRLESVTPLDELRFPLHSAAKNWTTYLENQTPLSETTINHYANRLRLALRAINEDYPDQYPKIESGFLRRSEPKSPNGHLSLGELPWPELEKLSGVSRERAALEIIREEAIKLFAELEMMFWFGQSMLSEVGKPPVGADPQAWKAIRTRLQEAVSSGSKVKPKSNRKTRQFVSLSDPNLWKSAGLDVDVTRRGPLVRRGVSKLMDFCMTPTLELCHLAAVIYCCAKGWNRQPIFDISGTPFLFGTHDKCGVVTSTFLSELKNRAGHEVTSYVESARHLPPLQLQNLKDLVREMQIELPHFAEGAFEELAADDAALDVLIRFQRIVDHGERAHVPEQLKSFFFYYKSNGKYRLAKDSKKPLSYLKLFQRPGLDYPAIRKTVLGLKLRAVGSIEALSVIANHRDPNVLMPHYINTDADKQEYSDKIRFVQNDIQALLLRGRKKILVRLRMSTEQVEYYLKITKISGIGAAMLPMKLKKKKAGGIFEFEAEPDYFLDLYLISFSLVRARLDGIDPLRWRVQGRELLIMARGIKTALVKSGLGAALREQSRKGFAGLKANTISLPVLLD